LRLVVEQKASDLHFHSGVVPLIRHDGDLVPLNFRALSESVGAIRRKSFVSHGTTPRV
jgi:Tfp pilus assembly pilus retraction ATPase PilT